MKKIFFIFVVLFMILNCSTSEFYPCNENGSCPSSYISKLNNAKMSLSKTKEELYTSKLSKSERESYELMIDLKRSFSSSLTFVSMSFSPEKKSYWEGLTKLLFVFFIISLFPLFFIILHLLLRFVFGKCSGPRKMSDVNRLYRNSAWVVMIISNLVIIVLFSIILGYSVKTHNAVKNSFDNHKMIENKKNLYGKIDEIVVYFRNNNLNAPNELFMKELKTNIQSYIDISGKNVDEILDNESYRNVGMILLYLFYIITIILTYVFFYLKWRVAECILTIFVFLSIPAMMVFQGYNAKFFFFYGDLCDSVNSVMYENEPPVAGQSIGYYYNCYNKLTRSQFFGIRYELFNSANQAKEEHIGVMEKFNKFNEKVLTPEIKCNLASEIIPKIESDFCLYSIGYLYHILLLITWLLLFTFIYGLALRRFEVLIKKKNMEIDSMVKNLESVY